jgi:type VI secretion system secreted protein VgrG
MPKNKPSPPPVPFPATTPKDCQDAPKAIKIPKDLQKQFDEQWKNSFPGGKSQEHGGTLVRSTKPAVEAGGDPATGTTRSCPKTGDLSMVNSGSGLNASSGSFSPDRNVPAGTTAIGVFHTHPYDASEGGNTDVSLSGGDAAYMINKGDPAIIAQSGDGQFMYLRTQQTPANVDYTKLDDDQNARISELVGDGRSFSEASQIAAKETAQKYHLAYYEGKGGVLRRVSC